MKLYSPHRWCESRCRAGPTHFAPGSLPASIGVSAICAAPGTVASMIHSRMRAAIAIVPAYRVAQERGLVKKRRPFPEQIRANFR